ncbi:MAG: hypothetical protein XD87_0425 [candidate division WS6 bacterium 36_33]|uniref:Uncharacterized protein n=1 Tax=candidate division WS6 bacterium 36_33 TaxID=1641388 RepID=A0A117LTN6_9BACT|nr:MAG: hypothetical protein XD87_0425 [candidate division WS6 bacterium 36_33]
MNQIERQPKLRTGVEQVGEVLPPTSVEELNPPQEPVASEGLTPPVSVDTETEVTPKVEQAGTKLSYGFPLVPSSNEEDPANIVAEKIQGLPPRE